MKEDFPDLKDLSSRMCVKFFDKDCKEISLDKWMDFQENKNYRIVKQEYFEEFFISTVWLGQCVLGQNKPDIFETMIFTIDDSDTRIFTDVWRYSTLDEAIQGHENVLKELKDGKLFK